MRIFSKRAVICLAFALVLSLGSRACLADIPVDLELVLAIDVSGSVDAGEYYLQVEGLVMAFRDPEVIAAISRSGPNGIAVAIVQWSGFDEHRLAVKWNHLSTKESIEAFAIEIADMKRYFQAGDTLLGSAMKFSSIQFIDNGFTSDRRVIDVSGDGGVESLGVTAKARDNLVASGFVINGLAIEKDVSNLSDFYTRNVVGGLGAFVMSATSYRDFQAAIRRKLIREIFPANLSMR